MEQSTPAKRMRAIVCIMSAIFAFAVMDTIIKVLSQQYAPLQVAALRGAASLPFIVLLALIQGRPRDLLANRWGLQIARGVLTILMLVLYVFALRTMSLSSAYAIFLSAPLLVTALSVLILKEHVDVQRWLAIAVGLAGVVVLLKPNPNEIISLAALAMFAASACYAVGAIMIRMLSHTETTLSTGFTVLLVIAIGSGVLALPHWQSMTMADGWLVFALGLSGAAGQYLFIEAFRSAPASVMAPFDYTALLWAMLIDWVLWQTIPHPRMLIGAAIVIASGMYLIYRERVVQAIPSS
jgi:drug/metabolite transporter (DMT)-like permease